MDTRSVVRSRRRSTRLTGQPPPDERVKRPPAGQRRHSDHNTPAKTNSNASREGSCPQMGPTSKTSSSHIVHHETAATDETKTVVKTEKKDLVPPIFPNLRLSKAKTTRSPRNETDHTTVHLQDPVDASSDNAVKGPVSRRWVKTSRGSIRLASEAPAESTKNNTDNKPSEDEDVEQASSANSRRRSRRLASMTPDMAGDTVGCEPNVSRQIARATNDITTEPFATEATGEDAEKESEPDLQNPFIRATSKHDLTTRPTHQELLIQDEKPGGTPQDANTLQNTSPIPELVADIEKIIQSSPLADRNSVNDGTKRTWVSTPTKALRRRASANMGDRGRMLRSSSRTVESTSKIGERQGIDQTDSESSQFDGAFDDSIRGRRKKARAARDKIDASKPGEPRGIKRSASKLSQDEGSRDAPGPRQRRKPNGDEPKPEESHSPTNPIASATSRGSVAVENPDIEDPLNISDFAQTSDEPANSVTLAQLIGTNQERADSDADSMAAECGSQGGASQSQSPEGGTHKCADCGRAPKRYLICAKCKETIYCGKYCQIWNWPLHKMRCLASDTASQAEIEQQEAYLGDMWAAALKVLEEEKKTAGGTLESVLLGEAVRHSPTRPWFMGQVSPRGFVAFDVDASRSAPRDAEAVDRARAMSVRLAQAALGSDQ